MLYIRMIIYYSEVELRFFLSKDSPFYLVGNQDLRLESPLIQIGLKITQIKRNGRERERKKYMEIDR